MDAGPSPLARRVVAPPIAAVTHGGPTGAAAGVVAAGRADQPRAPPLGIAGPVRVGAAGAAPRTATSPPPIVVLLSVPRPLAARDGPYQPRVEGAPPSGIEGRTASALGRTRPRTVCSSLRAGLRRRGCQCRSAPHGGPPPRTHRSSCSTSFATARWAPTGVASNAPSARPSTRSRGWLSTTAKMSSTCWRRCRSPITSPSSAAPSVCNNSCRASRRPSWPPCRTFSS